MNHQTVYKALTPNMQSAWLGTFIELNKFALTYQTGQLNRANFGRYLFVYKDLESALRWRCLAALKHLRIWKCIAHGVRPAAGLIEFADIPHLKNWFERKQASPNYTIQRSQYCASTWLACTSLRLIEEIQ